MKKFVFVIMMFAAVMWCSTMSAQDEPARVDDSAARIAAKTITDNYRDWQRVTLSGKLDLENTVVSPSVKIYMVRDKSIVISIRVPLLGEVGTVDITPTYVNLVNKVKKTYCREEIAGLMAGLPVGIADLQNLFLGRIFLPGYGTLSMDNYGHADFYIADNEEGWFIVPQEQPVEYEVVCGFNTFGDGRTDNIFVGTLDSQNQATAEYSYDNNKVNIDLTVRTRGKDREFGFRINETDFNGSPVRAAQPDGKYRKVGLSEFFKNLI